MKKSDSTMVEILKEENKTNVEHIIMDINYTVLYCNNDLLDTALQDKTKVDTKKCYEIYGRNKPCTGCKLEDVVKYKKSITWEAVFKNSKGYDVKKEVTLYPTLNSKNEVEKVVSVRLEKKDYNEDNMIEVFSCIADSKEAYAKEHSKNVRNICKALGREMKLTQKEQKKLEIAARLHDIGNIVISDEILGKEEITEEEKAIIKKHPVYSEEILKKIKSFEEIGRIVRSHHERYDGDGYPDRIAGEDIPLESRIITVADAYDAMDSHRVYKSKMTEKEIIREIVTKAGSQFDPRVVRALLSIISKLRS